MTIKSHCYQDSAKHLETKYNYKKNTKYKFNPDIISMEL